MGRDRLELVVRVKRGTYMRVEATLIRLAKETMVEGEDLWYRLKEW